MFAVSNFTRLLPFIVLTLQCCMKVSWAAAGSEKDVHYWFLPTQGAVKEANEMEVFHEYKPQCVQITSDMYPCNSLQYTSLRMPNLLGQSTIAEVKSFLDSFGDSKFLGCDQYAKHFLCSLVTPLCFDGKPQFKIPPCRYQKTSHSTYQLLVSPLNTGSSLPLHTNIVWLRTVP